MPSLARPSFALGLALALATVAACGVRSTNGNTGPGGDTGDLTYTGGGLPDLFGADLAGTQSCAELTSCFTVYAHSNDTLYKVDLTNKALVRLGLFNTLAATGKADTMTDLAVAPDNTIYVASKTNLYTADPTDGHVTLVGPLTTCGSDNVALTTVPDGTMYAGDYKGAFCRIDYAKKPPAVTQITASIGGGWAISGDIVAVSDGTMYGTAYQLAGGSKTDSLVVLDPRSGMQTQVIGDTGFPKLYGVAFDSGVVFGFTHDGSGDVVTVDPKTGKGTLYNTFKDPMTNLPISFAGAGVNPMVQAPNPG